MQAEKSHPTSSMAAMADVNNSPTISIDYTSIRSKISLISPSEEQYELLKKRLQDRIDDSRGETIYDVGIGEGNVLITCLIDWYMNESNLRFCEEKFLVLEKAKIFVA